MRRTHLIAALGCLLCVASASAQDVGMPGVMYSDSIAAGTGGQLFPFDRQDPWLHGQYQRVPAYGGFNSFRPYNYRHVLSQTQIATSVWGASHGTPYSQQFWNRYRQPYLNGNLHSQAVPVQRPLQQVQNSGYGVPAAPVSYQAAPLLSGHAPAQNPYSSQPVHVYPGTAGY
ncbi:MAG: hypothetical protein R3C19_06460 [Planctomycetaceae bacterium]